MKLVQSILLLSSILLITSCGEESEGEGEEAFVGRPMIVQETINLKNVQRISNIGFILNNKDTVSISTGPDRQKFIDISIYRSNIIDDYQVTANANNDLSISVNASWDGVTFVQSDEHDTFVNFDIVSIDTDNLLATLNFSALLVNPETDQALQIEQSKLEIGGLNFYTFTQGHFTD